MTEHELQRDAGADTTPESPDVFPWPPQPGESALEGFFVTWRDAVLHPTSFFRRMPAESPLGPPLVFYLIVGIAAAGFDLFWQSVFGTARLLTPFPRLAGEGGVGAAELVEFLVSPIVLAVVLGAATVVIHATLAVTGARTRGIGATLRALCYAYAPRAFAIVPLGDLVGSVWMLVIAIIGLREVHRTDGWRSAVAVLLPFALLLTLVAVAAFLGGVLTLLA